MFKRFFYRKEQGVIKNIFYNQKWNKLYTCNTSIESLESDISKNFYYGIEHC